MTQVYIYFKSILLFFMWSLLVKRHISDYCLWYIFQSSLHIWHITISCIKGAITASHSVKRVYGFNIPYHKRLQLWLGRGGDWTRGRWVTIFCSTIWAIQSSKEMIKDLLRQCWTMLSLFLTSATEMLGSQEAKIERAS